MGLIQAVQVANEDIDDFRVKLSPGTFFQFLDGFFEGVGVPVTSTIGHGIKSICNGEDSSQGRNIFSV